MGTHMWSSAQVSRRGRRMSLELPPGSHPGRGLGGPLGVGGPIPLNAKDSEFLQRRPDLFYPYLTAASQQSHLHTQFNNGGQNPPLLPTPSQLQVKLTSQISRRTPFHAIQKALLCGGVFSPQSQKTASSCMQ